MSKEQWVIVHYWAQEPTEVYGTFDTEQAAYDYAEAHGFAADVCSAYEVQCIKNVNEEDDYAE